MLGRCQIDVGLGDGFGMVEGIFVGCSIDAKTDLYPWFDPINFIRDFSTLVYIK